MNWYPLILTHHIRTYAFGVRLIPEMLGKTGLPDGIVAETWEVSDYRDARATILNGELAGTSFHSAVMQFPDEIVGDGWRGPHFPLLAKFLDASHLLPIHLHADNETALRKYNEPNGKSEAWHILWAEPEASILAGVHPGVSREDLISAFRRQDYDAVMYRHPIASGDTVYVPGGVLHSFGPNTLIFEIQQTSDLGQNVMPHDLYGNRLTDEDWTVGIERTLDELKHSYLPIPNPGLGVERNGNLYRYGRAGPHFALERWALKTTHKDPDRPDRCLIVSNVGNQVIVRHEFGEFALDRATSCVIPAAIGPISFDPATTGDLIVCYVPNLRRDIIEPLRSAGYSEEEIRSLGEIHMG